jgi:hypothetical protein
MNDPWYLLDTNVLSQLTKAQRATAFVREHCRIPSEVLHETAGFPDIATLRKLEYRVAADVLECVREVMKTVAPGDFNLVDLYRNLGSADPLLIASAMVEVRKGKATLFPEDWVIVSDDAAVRAKAVEVGLSILGAQEFAALLPDR